MWGGLIFGGGLYSGGGPNDFVISTLFISKLRTLIAGSAVDNSHYILILKLYRQGDANKSQQLERVYQN